MRVHRSYIIQIKKLTAYSKNEVEINTVAIPIGNSYKENWLHHLDTALLK